MLPALYGRSLTLLTDLYQLNMVEAYLAEGETKPAVFEFLVRRLPDRRGFLVAAGLEQALDYLETLRYPLDELRWLGTRSSAQPPNPSSPEPQSASTAHNRARASPDIEMTACPGKPKASPECSGNCQ